MADPKVSVVIISYNMARELPRTIKSFSPTMQRGVGAKEYELIVVDNGSARLPAEQELKAVAISPGDAILAPSMHTPTSSPRAPCSPR